MVAPSALSVFTALLLLTTADGQSITTASLGAKNGVSAHRYDLLIVKLSSMSSGSYSTQMISTCKKSGMKPVCDHPSYCKNDRNAVYIGQTGHLAYPPHRHNKNYAPAGLDKIHHLWNGHCSYTGKANGNSALCNIPANSHSWRKPSQVNPGFICAKVEGGGATMTAHLGAKNGVKAHSYEFKVAKLSTRSGSYSAAMIAGCKRLGMKPVCDHRNYCKNDKQALYIGQTHHLAYKPHRAANYVPTGFDKIHHLWNGHCSYTGHANGNSALCNIPANSHSWRKPSQVNIGYVCGKIVGGSPPPPVTSVGGAKAVHLGAKNGVKAHSYEFKVAKLSARSGSYSTVMVAGCKQFGMKPVCDHRQYCKNDKQALYIGQTNHIAYAPHRHNKGYMPSGFDQVQHLWNGLCSYTAKARGNYALCNIPANTHAWRTPAQANPGFMCGKIEGQAVHVRLGAKNNVAAHTYEFKVAHLSTKSGAFSAGMLTACKQIGMKPVCDHPSYCRNDKRALYIGQTSHIAYFPYRQKPSYMPAGFAVVSNLWNGLCSYTGKANGNKALCNIPANTHNWQGPNFNKKSPAPGFVCGKIVGGSGSPMPPPPPPPTSGTVPVGALMTATLDAKNGVAAHTYDFKKVQVNTRSGSYSAAMLAACRKVGMKPVCDHPNYCKNDGGALYIGQSSHIAYAPHRHNKAYMPTGFNKIQHMWNGVCSYTAHANGNNALCNIPKNSHAWRTPAQANPGIVCGRVHGSSLSTGSGDECSRCGNFKEFQTCRKAIEKRCCDEPHEVCVHGRPKTCNTDCSSILLPAQKNCAKFLSSSGLHAMRQTMDVSASTCKKLSCRNFAEFRTLSNNIHAACCDNHNCPSGSPNTCNKKCEKVLVPAVAACNSFLNNNGLDPVHATLSKAASKCHGH